MRLEPRQKRPPSRFRGIRVGYKGTQALHTLPSSLKGGDAASFVLDQWVPLSDKDKALSTALIERDMEWIPTASNDVIYGLERWGKIDFKTHEDWLEGSNYQDYDEWFVIDIIRPTLLSPEHALELASIANPVGSPKE